MTCRAHWFQLWRRPHDWVPLLHQPEHSYDALWCPRCDSLRKTRRVDSRTH